MKKILFLILLCFCALSFSREFPDEYYALRDAMYNFEKTPAEMEREVQACIQKARQSLSGYELNVLLARYEYILGRAYSYNNQKSAAEKHFDNGMEYAKKALDLEESSQSQLIYAENVVGNCAVKPFAWVIIWGPKVGGLAKKVLKFDPRNGAALYMQSAQDIYAPKAFSNYKRGIKDMSALLDSPGTVILDKDDKFNVKSAIGYAHLRLGNTAEARIWLKQALEIYPGNKFVKELLETNNAKDVVQTE